MSAVPTGWHWDTANCVINDYCNFKFITYLDRIKNRRTAAGLLADPSRSQDI
jgi:hypothetical protein